MAPTRESTPAAGTGDTTISNITSSAVVTTGPVVTSNLTSNATVLPSTQPDGDRGGMPGGVIALLIGLLIVGIAIFLVFLFLKRSGRLYRLVPFKPLVRSRRSSTAGSTRPLDLDPDDPGDHREDHGDLPKPRDGDMFTIDDMDMDTVDIESQSRGTNDEYFYDEVFGKSQFEDEVTNASMRQLYLSAAEDDEMLDVDAIVSHITGESTRVKT